MTFEWEDITEELFEKVVCFSFYASSGLGGPGALKAVTENGQIYFIGLSDCKQASECEIKDRFLGDHPAVSSEELKRTQEIGKWHVTRFLFTDYFIRKDYADQIISEWKKSLDKQPRSVIGVARKLFDPQKKQPLMVLSETQRRLDEEERQRREREEWRVRNRLVEGEDYEWKTFGNGYCELCYLLLFEEDKDGTISGSKWTIVYQKEQFEEGGIRSDAPTEAYNLYYKRYKNWDNLQLFPQNLDVYREWVGGSGKNIGGGERV